MPFWPPTSVPTCQLPSDSHVYPPKKECPGGDQSLLGQTGRTQPLPKLPRCRQGRKSESHSAPRVLCEKTPGETQLVLTAGRDPNRPKYGTTEAQCDEQEASQGSLTGSEVTQRQLNHQDLPQHGWQLTNLGPGAHCTTYRQRSRLECTFQGVEEV